MPKAMRSQSAIHWSDRLADGTDQQIWQGSGLYQIVGGQASMLVICLLLLYLGIVKKFEPLLLVTIGFGGLLVEYTRR